MSPDAARGGSLGIDLSMGVRLAIDKEWDGTAGTYVERTTRGLINFFDPAER